MNKRLRKWLVSLGLTLGTLTAIDLTLLVSGSRVLVHEDLVQPGENYIVPHYGNLAKNGQASLVCRYFTGRGFINDVLWYSANNLMGHDQCPFLGKEVAVGEGKSESNLADWFSGIGSMLAVFVALGGYWWSERQKKKDDDARRQGYIHQISFKLSTLASEAAMAKKDLNPYGKTDAQLSLETDPFEIVGTFSPNVGYDDTMVRDLATDEQNLLMLLKENDFLMDFSEAVARNESIRRGLLEYKARRDAVLSMLPPPQMVNGKVVSHMLTQQQKLELSPWIIPLGTVVLSSRALAKENVELLARLCNAYKPMMTKHFPNLNIHTIEMGI